MRDNLIAINHHKKSPAGWRGFFIYRFSVQLEQLLNLIVNILCSEAEFLVEHFVRC